MRDVIWNFANNVGTRGLLFLFSLLLAKFLPPAQVGVFAAVMLMILYLQLFFGWQLPAGIVQRLQADTTESTQGRYFAAGIVLTLSLSVIGVLLCVLARPLISSLFRLDVEPLVYLMGVSLLPWRMLRDYLNRCLQAKGDFKRPAVLAVSVAILQLACGAGFLLLSQQAGSAVLAVYLCTAVSMAVLAVWCWGRYRWIADKETFAAARDIWFFSGAIYAASIVVFLATKLDSFFVNYFLTKDQLALYTYAIEFAMMFTLLGDSISQVNYPKFAAAFQSGELGTVHRIYSKSVTYTFLVVASGALMFLLFSAEIVRVLLTPFYLGMLPSLRVLIVGVVPFAAISSVGTIMTAKGLPLYDVLPASIGLACTGTLCFLLVPQFGLFGAAIAAAASFAVRAVIGIVVIHCRLQLACRYAVMAILYGIFIGIVMFDSITSPGILVKLALLATFCIASCWLLAAREMRQALRVVRAVIIERRIRN